MSGLEVRKGVEIEIRETSTRKNTKCLPRNLFLCHDAKRRFGVILLRKQKQDTASDFQSRSSGL